MQSIHPTVHRGTNTTIEAEELTLEQDVWIGDNVTLRARRVHIGRGSRLEDRVQVGSARGGPASFFHLGEQCLLGNDVKVALPALMTGDYVSIHNHTLLNGAREMTLGHNNWIGQNCLLNSEAPLWLGNNVGIGAYSGVYTHGYWGELLEGCRICKTAPVVLHDDVWVLGSYNVISPGIEVGEKATVLTGSVVSKSVPAGSVVGGSPARPMNWDQPMYQVPGPEEKLALMRSFIMEFLQEFALQHTVTENGFRLHEPAAHIWFEHPPANCSGPQIGVVRHADSAPPDAQLSLFDLGGRRYFRTRQPLEIRLIKFLKSYRARFVPADNPRITMPKEYVL
jgi:acetyltransferase-like isoleucine patch superfamily enzyme